MMTATIIEDANLRNQSMVFRDRKEAGEHLARALEPFLEKDDIVLAIPSGGVPVGLAVSSRLKLPFDLLIARKILIQSSIGSGLGAISLEGDLVLNEPLVRSLGLSPEDIEEIAAPVQEELRVRERVFRENRPWPKLNGRNVILVDEGLAAGYTMTTSARTVRRKMPSQIIVAVPTAHESTIKRLANEVDLIVCSNIRNGHSFDVADAYRSWHDLSREEVVSLLRQARK
jgi:predicted phosphoribosyltransferase